jgi:cytoskeletal protein CcmA (bactofilin family)
VAEQGKKHRPLLEALMAKTDGLDILAEITGEKAPEEKRPGERKEAAAPADTFGGMLQSLPMLVMLPAIMPLLQQMLTQTLAASTVNVKVESATTILPIEISASTAIVPIEIKASSVTLNVNITGSNVTLNVSIQSSQVMLDVNVTNNILNVNIANSQTTLNINIVSSQTTLNTYITNSVVAVSITNTSLNVNATIVQSNVTLSVNVTNSALNVNATIVQSNVTLNVNITRSDVTLNVTGTVSISGTVNVTGTVSISGTVNVTGTVSISGTVNVTGTVSISGTVNVTGTVNATIIGTVNINIQTQNVDVQLTETFWTMRGGDKVLSGWDYVTPVGGVYYNYVIEYTVPSGKRLVVYAIDITLQMVRYYSSDEIASRYPTAGWYPTLYTYGDDVEVELRKGTTVLATFECRPTNPHLRHEFRVPKIYNAGEVLRIWAHAKLGYSLVEVSVYGVELAT